MVADLEGNLIGNCEANVTHKAGLHQDKSCDMQMLSGIRAQTLYEASDCVTTLRHSLHDSPHDSSNPTERGVQSPNTSQFVRGDNQWWRKSNIS